MIAFSCSHCGVKLKVKPEFAGRSSRCPSCKQPQVVPQPGPTQGIAEGAIDGTASSLIQIGLDAGVSLSREGVAMAGPKSINELLERRSRNSERYIIAQEIARGGMGAILRAADCDIRREVAIKYLLDQTDTRKKLRFVEEAQITGQLEHPNIVPIHELGIDSRKRLFFSMKMVRGRSLAQVLDELRKSPKPAEKEHSLARLLNVFVSICNAVAYAHSRGVIHRDLKPANVMLGDFGEVYVMDWGLARVLNAAVPVDVHASPTELRASNGRASKVETSRIAEADLTQDGAILGTPSYMAPEQATGHVDGIDQRSDLYSLGAILYEMLALLPPVDKEGSYLEVMMRVVGGAIVPPEQRSPQRAREGKIPRELSAVAMKALARLPKDRYPTVEALRRDIERFQEGRSVSAKRDSLRERAWKLAKRNLAVTLVSAVALVLLAALWARSSWISHREQELRRELAVPAFIEAAHFAVERKKFDNALVQVATAVEYDPERADARLLKGQLLIVRGDYAAAQAELQQYLKLKPDDAAAVELVELCRKARPGDTAHVASLADVFRRQNALALAASMFQSREDLLALYRRQLDAAWPGAGANLDMDKGGFCTFAIPGGVREKVTDLTPLRGMPLVKLNLSGCSKLKDLGPLRDLPLTSLNLDGCSQVKDLIPLQGMKLTALSMFGVGQLRDLAPLQNMPLTYLNLAGCEQISDLTPLQGMKLTSLNLWNCQQVKELTPLKGMPLTSLSLLFCQQIKDLSILQTLPELTALDLFNCGQVHDLSVLRGLKLTALQLSNNGNIKDLTPLQGMPLTQLRISNCQQIADLAPLKGMPLTVLEMQNNPQIRDLAPLAGMKLTSLDIINCAQVHDLTPLQGMSLVDLYVSPKNINRGIDACRGMKSLRLIAIGGQPNERFSPDQFWKKYEAGEFK
jgi:serine/threonine protein kinase